MMKFKIVGEENLISPDVYQGNRQHIDALDNFKWTAGANVQAKWRKHGWVPPSEVRNDYLFQRNRDGK
jgi:hypothetical protein